MSPIILKLSYAERLLTFADYWTDHAATARQLAAIGHISDRPPLESLEEGSRCMTCSRFVSKAISIDILEGSMDHSNFSTYDLPFHHARCERLQVRLPIDSIPGWAVDSSAASSFTSARDVFEKRIAAESGKAVVQQGNATLRKSSFWTLPAELRLQIYSHVLPALDPVATIVPLHGDSTRVTSKTAARRALQEDKGSCTLLQTSREMYVDGVNYLFRRTFRFDSTKVLYIFLRRIGNYGRQCLRSIDVTCGGREDAVAFALLACCENLKEIIIRLPRPKLLFARAPLWSNDGMAALLELRGMDIVSFANAKSPNSLQEGSDDGKIVHRELTRPRGQPGAIRSVDGVLDI